MHYFGVMPSFATADSDCKIVLLAFSRGILMKQVTGQYELIKFMKCGSLTPTSNGIEILISKTGYVDDDLRQNLLPLNSEQFMNLMESTGT